jgi:cysteine desulfurase family protein (TIGR01976 family)
MSHPFPSIDRIRAQFPGLASSTVFLDNAGGSQVPACVADAVHRYYTRSYAQLGGQYPESLAAKSTVDAAHTVIKTLMNAHGVGEVALGASTSAICHMLADCYANAKPGRTQIIASTAAHQANLGPWQRLASRGFDYTPWPINRDSLRHEFADLRERLSSNTLIVAFPHVSNLLGDIEDAKALVNEAHAAGAKVLIDGVAFAPHRAIDVQALGCDWYVFSTYKVFGPHMAALFGTHEAFSELTGPNHFFIKKDAIPYKFELGGVNHEGCAAITALADYLRFLSGEQPDALTLAPAHAPLSRATVERAFSHIMSLETSLQDQLITWLRSRPDISIIGPACSDASRVSTISFTHNKLSSQHIATTANAAGFGLRFGHFYSLLLAEQLTHDPLDGVVRASLLHYNTPDEVDRLIRCLERLLPPI